ncbi:MAG: LysE family translocator [Clostridiales bacterium]|nr:LysE family translocator [Clostridiales bacterium]
MGIINFGAFLTASILLNMTPGADTIYILTKSASGGRRQGIASALGITSGILIHTVLAALGLSAVLAASAAAFSAMKLLGAAYLFAMGVRMFLKKDALVAETKQKEESLPAVYRQGVLTNALNPKVALFFLALLPQYVEADAAHSPLPFLLLGLAFVCTSTLWCLLVAFGASYLSALIDRNRRTSKLVNKLTGCIYIGLGANILRARISD